MGKRTALQRIRDAYEEGRGVRLTEDEVIELYEHDNALHTRVLHDDDIFDQLAALEDSDAPK